jgi:GNAT superfamily N-acetyltransferase
MRAVTARDSLPEGRVVTLRDGSRVLLRPIEPDDKHELEEGFARLSRQSRYRRFFTAMDRLSDRQLAYFTEVDYHDHFAWVALAIDEPGSPGVAVGRYIRLADDPTSADIALAVTDEFQGRGLGSVLLEALVDVARDNGIEHFVGHVLADNAPMLALLRKAGAATSWDEPGVLVIDFDLPDTPSGLRASALYQMLRDAARSAFGDRS